MITILFLSFKCSLRPFLSLICYKIRLSPNSRLCILLYSLLFVQSFSWNNFQESCKEPGCPPASFHFSVLPQFSRKRICPDPRHLIERAVLQINIYVPVLFLCNIAQRERSPRSQKLSFALLNFLFDQFLLSFLLRQIKTFSVSPGQDRCRTKKADTIADFFR